MAGHAKSIFNWKVIFAFIWLGFTLSLAGWWMILSLSQVEKIASLNPDLSVELNKQKTMLLWEGSAWMILLLLGGLTLIYLVRQEERRSNKLKEFFAAFSHDLKTSMASLKLQAESLDEDLGGIESPVLQRLVGDTVRLQLQLENSLFLANFENQKMYIESLSLKKVVGSLQYQWPKLQFSVKSDCLIRADKRALESVLKNLIQNAVVHGRATKMSLTCKRNGPNRVKIEVINDGRGFTGEKKLLGQLFYRHNPSSGSGVGLYITKQLLKRMNGDIKFLEAQDQGFALELDMEGGMG